MDIRIADCQHKIDTDNTTTFYELHHDDGIDVVCKDCFNVLTQENK